MTLHRLIFLLLAAAPILCAHTQAESAASNAAAMLGYSAPGALLQQQWEDRFRGGISPANIREYIRRLSAHPHHVGSAYDLDMGSPTLSARSLALVNADLLRVSRLFLNQNGLPERAWFNNQIYAPGAYTGYSAKPIAAVREYMDQQKWREAEAQVPQVAQVIEKAAAGINKAAEDFETEMVRSGLPGAPRQKP